MIGVIGVPFGEHSSFLRGSEKAPPFIRQAFQSDSANYFTESLIDLKNHAGWEDHGDLRLLSGLTAYNSIETGIENVLAQSDKILSLGGDHSITYPIIKAVAKKFGKLNILHLDAHSDLYHEFDGNKYSHACPFARIMEEGLAARLVQVGIRTINTHQRAQANRFGVEVFEMKNWQEYKSITFDGPVYISLDMDVIDPAFAPGVSHHEPGGLTTREVLTILQQLNGNIVGADLVEFNPDRDASGITAMLAAKLFKELLDVLLRE